MLFQRCHDVKLPAQIIVNAPNVGWAPGSGDGGQHLTSGSWNSEVIAPVLAAISAANPRATPQGRQAPNEQRPFSKP